MKEHIDNHGKKLEVLFQPGVELNNLTGERIAPDLSCFLWADANLIELISKIPGVAKVEMAYNKFRYYILFDPRYSVEFVKKEIEAEILCKKEEENANK